MLKLIIGVKGTGKTKTLIEMVNKALTTTGGHVVVIEKGTKLRYDVNNQARLVNVEEYKIDNAKALYGFLAGMLASDYDVTNIFVDSGLKICGDDKAAFEGILDAIAAISGETNVVMTASVPVEEADAVIGKYTK